MDKFYSLIIESGLWQSILSGLLVTLKISALSVLFGSLLGAGLCWARTCKIGILRCVTSLYIALIRGVPPLMLLMMMFYVIFKKSEPDTIAVITFSLNFSAYFAELMRSALSATDKGQAEAALTAGFTRLQVFRLITLPQALRIAKPVYESTIINLIQWTSVVGYVTITDLTRVINTASARTMEPVLMICTGMALYLALGYLVKGIFVLTDHIGSKRSVRA